MAGSLTVSTPAAAVAGVAGAATSAAAPTRPRPSARVTARRGTRIVMSFPTVVPRRRCPARHRRHGTGTGAVQIFLEVIQIEPSAPIARVGAESATSQPLKEIPMRTPLILLGAALLAGVAACGSPAKPAAQASAPVPSSVQVETAQSSLGPLL